MKLTNRFGLPDAIVRAIQRDPYSKGNAHWSVTELIDAPRISVLKTRHRDEIERDVVDLWWSLLGRAIHHILEEGGRKAALDRDPDEPMEVEERIFLEVEGYTISGAIDLQDWKNEIALIDWKTTTAASVTRTKTNWERQLNIYAALMRRAKGIKVDRLMVWAIVRDWSQERIKDPSYPQAPIVPIEIPLWSDKEADDYLLSRVRAHAKAADIEWTGEELPFCSDDDRWFRPSKWAVMKEGGKKATSLHDSMEEAQEAIQGRKGYILDERRGGPLRCQRYCDVSAFCSQWLKERHLYASAEVSD